MTQATRRTFTAAGLAALGLGGAGIGRARAQSSPAPWPTRPVRLILPFGPGTGVDVGARLLSDKLSARWGQPVIVDNRPGGDGIIAMTAYLNANDDHVLLYAATGSYTVHPYQIEKLPYNLQRDALPIARVANTILAAAVPASMKINSLKEFVALARAQPGKLNAAMPQGLSELVFDGFVKAEGLQIEKVPYKDIVQGVPDLVEGRLHMIYSSYSTVRPVAESGTVKALAVSSKVRAPSLPDIPTAIEAGVPSLTIDGLSGIFGPAKMPLELRQRIGADVVKAMEDQTILARLVASGQTPVPGGPDEMAGSLKQQIDQVDAIAKLIGLAKK